MRAANADEMPSQSTLHWLLDSDPAIRWQVMRDLMHESEAAVAAERARVANEGWGATLLDRQGPDGNWEGGIYMCPGWIATSDTLLELKQLGVDPNNSRVKRAIALVRDSTSWGPEFDNNPFFEGETEACINGRALSCGAYFGEASEKLVARLLSERLEDGGWNCYPSHRSSFHSTICVLEGLLEYQNAHGGTPELTAAQQGGQVYLLERQLLRSRSSGTVINDEWTKCAYPNRWHYDVLWGLDYLRRAGVKPDARVAEAVSLIESKRDADGRWLLEHVHEGAVHFQMEELGQPSRWITLRALLVLEWYAQR